MADTLTVTSSAFEHGKTLPMSAVHSMAGGENTSPDLQWSGVPEGTQSIAVTCYDPDAPTSVGFVHWVLFNIDPSVTRLESGAGAPGSEPTGSVAGYTDFGGPGYGGAAPPPGPAHHYHFTVYALDTKLDLDSSATYAYFRFNILGHVLAEGTLTGTYSSGE